MVTEQLKFDAIGTAWVIDVELPNTLSADTVLQKVEQCIEQYDKVYSRFRPDSVVSALAARPGEQHMPENAQDLLQLYHQLYRLTDGAFTPLIGNTLVDAGYDAQYSLRPGKLSAPPKWDDVIAYSHPVLELRESAILDFGAAGKGHLVDEVATLLSGMGVLSYTVDAGGDIRHFSPNGKRLRVGLEHPGLDSQVIGVAEIGNAAVCCSAGNRRAWTGFHHIIDPRTLSSPSQILSCWVVAETTLLADAVATALFLVSPETLAAELDFQYCILYPDFSCQKSSGFEAELYMS